MADKLTVMISSTVQDLPEHRQQVMEACLYQDCFPKMAEQLPASDEDSVDASLAMVDESDVYLGVYGWRYGYLPAGQTISLTEMEHLHAQASSLVHLQP